MTEILLYGIIGDWWDGLDAATLVPLITEGNDDLHIRINSPGGYVMEGLAIYNAIVRQAAEGRKVTCFVDGLAASMGSVIAMAGNDIVMADGSLMMIHNPWDCACGDAAELRKKADELDKVKGVMVGIYTKKTGLSDDEIIKIMDVETWLTPVEAMAQGFATSIGAASTAEACFIKPFGFQKAPDSPRITAMAMSGNKRTAPAGSNPPNMENRMPETLPGGQSPTPTPTPTPAATGLSEADAQARVEQAVATERARVTGIRALGAKHSMDVEFVDGLIADGNCTLACAREKILDKLAEAGDAKNISHSAATVTTDAREKFMTGAVNWILVKTGTAAMVEKAAKARGETIKIDAGEFRGMRNSDLAREALVNMGVRNIGRDPDSVVRAALTARDNNNHAMYAKALASMGYGVATQTFGDFPILLEVAMHKILQAAYQIAPDTWTRFCGIGSVTDFRAHNRYLRGSFGVLDGLNELGELKNKAIPDGAKESITAKTKGNIIGLSRQAIVNDDMDVFSGLIPDLGRAAKLTIEVDVYALIASNPTMNDGVAFFHANHGNLGSASTPPSVAAFDAIRVAMAKQKDVSGNDYLEIKPSIGLFPTALGGTARVINAAQYDPDTANKLQRPNMVRDMLSDIVDSPRTPNAVDYYMFADKDVAPAFEVAFLNGVTEPFTDSEEGWRVDGWEAKVRHDYGVAGVNWRSGYKQVG